MGNFRINVNSDWCAGMVQLQFQARVDIVQFIDLLEKACIRFVHFSKENELRSRVFSEKMGLESGWNCHISLRYILNFNLNMVSKICDFHIFLFQSKFTVAWTYLV